MLQMLISNSYLKGMSLLNNILELIQTNIGSKSEDSFWGMRSFVWFFVLSVAVVIFFFRFVSLFNLSVPFVLVGKCLSCQVFLRF